MMSVGGWAECRVCADTGARTPIGVSGNFKGDSAETCAGKFPLMSMGGWAEGLACADPGARTPIGVSGNSLNIPSNDCDIEIVKKAYNSAWLDLGFLVSSGESWNKWLLAANTRIFGQKESYLLCPECSGNRLPALLWSKPEQPNPSKCNNLLIASYGRSLTLSGLVTFFYILYSKASSIFSIVLSSQHPHESPPQASQCHLWQHHQHSQPLPS